MRELYAYFGNRLIGVFHETGELTAEFEYVVNSSLTPISLSAPIDGSTPAWLSGRSAAYAFLDNLLPDREEVRVRWARIRGLPDTDIFTLLAEYGEDVAGALSLSPSNDLPEREPVPAIEATEDDIANRIAALRRESSSWLDPRLRTRTSIAGAQGKFSLARIGDRWFWPTYEYPSTHILKPPAREHRSVDLFEHLSLGLAREIGLSASHSQVMEFAGQSTFVVERWDRQEGVRLHAEDMNQALGNLTEHKYLTSRVGAPQVARALDRHGLGIEFVRQLAFNVALGNADAHAKNYSVLLAGKNVRLAPLYDTVPTYFWPRYRGPLAMPIGNAKNVAEASKRNWYRFAEDAGLEPELVWSAACDVITSVAEHYEPYFVEHGIDQARRAMISKHVRILKRLAEA